MAKQDGRKPDHKSLETLRLLAVRRVTEDGEKPSEVMRSLGLCRASIYPWLRAHNKKGQAALRMRKACGPQPKLTPRQCQQVRRWIIGKDPRQYGFHFGLWTRQIVARLIEEKYGIGLKLTAVGRQRQKVSAISAVSARGGFWSQVHAGMLNAGRFVEFLKTFRRGGRGKVFLVVDGHPSHRAKVVAAYVAACGAGWSCTSCRRMRRTSIRTGLSGSTPGPTEWPSTPPPAE